MYVRMYVGMYVCMHVCMYVCISVCMGCGSRFSAHLQSVVSWWPLLPFSSCVDWPAAAVQGVMSKASSPGSIWKHREASGSIREASGKYLEASSEGIWRLLKTFGEHLETGGHLEASGKHGGGVWRHMGSIWDASGRGGHLGCICGGAGLPRCPPEVLSGLRLEN